MEENRKQEKSAGDDWRYTKGHLNPYYSWYQKGETLFSPLTEFILLWHPLTTKTQTYFVFPYSVLVWGLNYVVSNLT